MPPTIHASAVLAGAHGVLIRGGTGAGKSRLVQSLLHAAEAGLLPFARLVADDRVHIEAHHGRLIARTPQPLAGLLEVRGIGISRMPWEQAAVVKLVVDLRAESGARLPEPDEASVTILGINLPRVICGTGQDPLPMVLTALAVSAGSSRL